MPTLLKGFSACSFSFSEKYPSYGLGRRTGTSYCFTNFRVKEALALLTVKV